MLKLRLWPGHVRIKGASVDDPMRWCASSTRTFRAWSTTGSRTRKS